MGEYRWRRDWFPDQQVKPEQVLAVLRERRQLALSDPAVLPFMTSMEIGWELGAVEDRRWRAPDTPPPPAPVDPTRSVRSVWGLRWRNPIPRRDTLFALNHYEAQGLLTRLPGPLARNGAVWTAHLDSADAAQIREAFTAMALARERARHTIAMGRLSATVRSQLTSAKP